jgi:hypothetical protein
VSVTYFLFRWAGLGPPEIPTDEAPPSFGAQAGVKAFFDSKFPDIQWQRWDDGTWFGTRYHASDMREEFEVQMSTDPMGQVTDLTVRRAYRELAIAIARPLGLVVFDPQANEIIEP